MLKRLFAVVSGIILGFITTAIIIRFSRSIYPEQANFIEDEAYLEFLQSLPTETFYLMILAHSLGAFVAAFVAAVLADSSKRYMGYIAGFGIFVFSIMILLSVPNPFWTRLVDPPCILISITIGAFLGERLRK